MSWAETFTDSHPTFTGPNTVFFCLSVRLGNDCHQFCPDGTYSSNDTMVCSPCGDKHCENCDQSQCYLCEEGFYIFGNIWLIYNLGLGYGVTIRWLTPGGNRGNWVVFISLCCFQDPFTYMQLWRNCELRLGFIWNTILVNFILYHIMSCYVMLCYIMLYYVKDVFEDLLTVNTTCFLMMVNIQIQCPRQVILACNTFHDVVSRWRVCGQLSGGFLCG